LTSRTWSAAADSGSASAFSTTITRPPSASGRKISKTERSKEIDVAASTPDSSSAVKTPAAHDRSATPLSCSIATPFGTPVLPEV
jgi:hypothetical protein